MEHGRGKRRESACARLPLISGAPPRRHPGPPTRTHRTLTGAGPVGAAPRLAPDQPFRALAESIAARWPEAASCGGQFTEVIPHLTVAHGQQPRGFSEVEAALANQLPATATVSSVSLFVIDGELWQQRAEFPVLGRSRPSAKRQPSNQPTHNS